MASFVGNGFGKKRLRAVLAQLGNDLIDAGKEFCAEFDDMAASGLVAEDDAMRNGVSALTKAQCLSRDLDICRTVRRVAP